MICPSTSVQARPQKRDSFCTSTYENGVQARPKVVREQKRDSICPSTSKIGVQARPKMGVREQKRDSICPCTCQLRQVRECRVHLLRLPSATSTSVGGRPSARSVLRAGGAAQHVGASLLYAQGRAPKGLRGCSRDGLSRDGLSQYRLD